MADEFVPLDAWRAVLRASDRVLRGLEADLQRAGGVPLTWYDVLLELHAADGPLRMGELADRVVLSRTRVSRLVGEIVAAGLVARTPDADDGRAQRVTLTPAGVEALRRTAPAYLEGVDARFTSHLSPVELRTVAEALGRVHDAGQR